MGTAGAAGDLRSLAVPLMKVTMTQPDFGNISLLQYKTASQTSAGTRCHSSIQNEKPATESILTMLMNDLATVPRDFILVLEDYHFRHQPGTYIALLIFLLERMPPRMHLVDSHSLEPISPLAHFRGKGMLLEIRPMITFYNRGNLHPAEITRRSEPVFR